MVLIQVDGLLLFNFLICFQYFPDPAEIIQSRFNEQENQFDYYVHYEGYNRRLDEWIPRDRYCLHRRLLLIISLIGHSYFTSCVCYRIMLSRFNMSDHQWKNDQRTGDLFSDQSDRKITRNQKRRHDEINHIQKV